MSRNIQKTTHTSLMKILSDARRFHAMGSNKNCPRAIGKSLFVKQGRSKNRSLNNGESSFIKRGVNLLPGAKCL